MSKFLEKGSKQVNNWGEAELAQETANTKTPGRNAAGDFKKHQDALVARAVQV